MVNIKKGDTVMVTNVHRIMFGEECWNECAVTTVADVEEFGIYLFCTKKVDEEQFDIMEGKPVMYVSDDEYHYLIKMKEDNK